MSETSTPVTAELFRYVAAHTAPEDEFLKELKQQAAAAGLPPIWIAPEQASFFQILMKLCGARNVVEVGTLAGYSAIAMARALPRGGRLRTIEISDTHADFAEQWVRRSDVADRIEVLRGDARQILPGFGTASADAAFIDADKESYSLYLRECLRIVRSGGLLLLDNAFANGHLLDSSSKEPMAPIVRAFNDYMAGVKELQSIIVPLGDGFWAAIKR